MHVARPARVTKLLTMLSGVQGQTETRFDVPTSDLLNEYHLTPVYPGSGRYLIGWHSLPGHNGQSSGPTIEVVAGDRVRLFVTNRLPESTSVHSHGQRLPNGMDGVSGLTQPGIPVGKTS